MKSLTMFTVTEKEVISTLAYQAIYQSPVFPKEMLTVLEKYSALLKSEFFSNAKKLGTFEYIEIGIEGVNSMANALRQIPEFLNWNLSENEMAAGVHMDDPKRSMFCFTSRFSGPSLHDDFIDIDAFVRNFASVIIYNSFQYRELVEKMDDTHR